MSSMNDSWNKITNFKFLENNIKRVLIDLRGKDSFRYWTMERKRSRTSKNSEKSRDFRKLGNWQYLKCNDSYCINSAIELFTKSIAYAPLRSTELSLAYANRSALLMKARLYDDALEDIRRALKTGYPDRLKAKLFLRRALCLKAAHPTAESDIVKAVENAEEWLKRMDKKNPSRQIVIDGLNDLNEKTALPQSRTKWNARRFLNGVFEENPEIIDASSSIAIMPMTNNEFGIMATRDIKPGEIISAQEPYAALLHEDRRYTNCWHCRDQTLSAIPCNSCVYTVFCSEICRDAAWSEYHSIECPILPMNSFVSLKVSYYGRVIMRMMIQAVKEAGNIQGLKEIIRTIERDPDLKRKGFSGSKFDGSKLSSIYGLPTYADTRTPREFKRISSQSLFIAFSLATQSNFFGEKMTLREFYQHELVPFVAVVLMRFSLISTGTLQKEYNTMDSPTTMDHSLTIVPLHAYITHSCAPNVSRCAFGSKSVIYAHYPIKRGEQIFQCRGLTFERNSKKDRQAVITQLFGHSCCCVACTENWPDTDLPHCNVSPVSRDLVVAPRVLFKSINKRLELARRGHFAVISKLINDLSVTISDWWDPEHPPSGPLTQAVVSLKKIFSVLSNRREFF